MHGVHALTVAVAILSFALAPLARAAEEKARIFDGKPKTVLVTGDATPGPWPVFLQLKLDRYTGGRIVVATTSQQAGAAEPDIVIAQPAGAPLAGPARAEAVAQACFEVLLAHDGLPVPEWSKDQLRRATGAPGGPPQARPPEPGTRLLADLEYARVGEKRLLLDLRLPEQQPAGPLPVIVWIHGGGWAAGDKAGCPAAPMVRRGYAVISIDYRLSQEATFPAQIHDCKAAVRWVRANAAKHGFDPDRIGVWGSSAGGHLVALLGASGGVKELEGDMGNPEYSSSVQAVCDWFGPTDFLKMDAAVAGRATLIHDAPGSPESRLIGGPIQQNKQKAAAANPIAYIAPGRPMPPFLIMHGDQDFTVPLNQSELLHEALKKAGADVTFHVVPGGGHGFVGATEPGLNEMAFRFFDEKLKAKPPSNAPPAAVPSN